MVLQVTKWNILPEKMDAYKEWSKTAVAANLSPPGVVEFRAYRMAAGTHQAVVTWEFANLEDWAKWHVHPNVQKTMEELYTYATNVTNEIWGPSPLVPEPVRPK